MGEDRGEGKYSMVQHGIAWYRVMGDALLEDSRLILTIWGSFNPKAAGITITFLPKQICTKLTAIMFFCLCKTQH